ncbi:MAG: hypothetical protein GY906_16035 [bacterium]|nr:hypothetical protein [bacterium]
MDSYKDDFITIKMSAFSEKKPEVPQEVAQGGARGMWFWHEGFESERDDYAFVDTLLTELLSSSDINIDPENILGLVIHRGRSSYSRTYSAARSI